MERITKAFREVENNLVFLASNPEMAAADREMMLPALSKLLEAENEWKIFVTYMRGNYGKN